MSAMKYRELVADKLSAAGWSWRYCGAITRHGWRWIIERTRGTVADTSSNLTSY
jgi:hypothetical protein